jgi:DegV family protein with EDD domain
MAGIQVVTDSACDLTKETAEDRGIQIVPLKIRFGDEEFFDREELSTKEFWDRVITGPLIPETAAPAPGAFRRAYLDAADQGRTEVLCITMSSRLSATYQAASTAAESVTDRIQVRIVDSLTVTVGEGLLVLSAVDMAEEGKPVDEIATSLEDLMSRTRVYGLLESLDFLRRGGRIGGAAHLMGSLLSIKPVLEVREGIVEVESKQRTRQRSLRYLASKALEAGPLERLAIANGAAKDVGELQEMLNGADVAHEIVMTDLGPVIGSHAGPGAIGVCFQLAR